ncbi:MAG: HAD family hydrolase [Desulfobulbaceae bacterium]|nr:HAD family hydrolase [Desulfobulbaceae bacterium]
MSNINAVLFDMYGTLVDIKTNEHDDDVFDLLSRFLEYRRVFISGKEIKELYFDQINQQFARSRERHPEIDVVRAFGHVLREYGGTTDHYLTMITAQLYRSLCRKHMRLYDDTFWTLNKFRKRYRLGIVSDAQRIFCKPELRTLRLENFFDAIVISSDYGFRKPDPRIFHMALAILDVPASEAVYIGNNYKTDLLGAKAAGMALAGLIRQSEDEKRAFREEPKPDFVAKDLRDAFNEILQNNKTP